MNSFKHVLRTRLFAVWSLMMLGISMLAIILLFWDFAAPKATETARLVEIVDTCICLFFFIDFLVLLSRSENKKNYMLTWGVFDLLSCIPLYGQFRVFRVGRIFRLLRAARTLRAGIQATTRPEGALISVVFMFISMWFSGVFFYWLWSRGLLIRQFIQPGMPYGVLLSHWPLSATGIMYPLRPADALLPEF